MHYGQLDSEYAGLSRPWPATFHSQVASYAKSDATLNPTVFAASALPMAFINLEALTLTGVQVGRSAFRDLRGCKRLTSLTLSRVSFASPSAAQAISALTALTALAVHSLHDEDRADFWEAAGSIRGLRSLDIRGIDQPTLYGVLQPLTRLQKLRLEGIVGQGWWCRMDPHTFRVHGELPLAMWTLLVRHTSPTQRARWSGAQLSLDPSSTPIPELRAVVQALGRHQQLSLSCTHDSEGGEGWTEVAYEGGLVLHFRHHSGGGRRLQQQLGQQGEGDGGCHGRQCGYRLGPACAERADDAERRLAWLLQVGEALAPVGPHIHTLVLERTVLVALWPLLAAASSQLHTLVLHDSCGAPLLHQPAATFWACMPALRSLRISGSFRGVRGEDVVALCEAAPHPFSVCLHSHCWSSDGLSIRKALEQLREVGAKGSLVVTGWYSQVRTDDENDEDEFGSGSQGESMGESEGHDGDESGGEPGGQAEGSLQEGLPEEGWHEDEEDEEDEFENDEYEEDEYEGSVGEDGAGYGYGEGYGEYYGGGEV